MKFPLGNWFPVNDVGRPEQFSANAPAGNQQKPAKTKHAIGSRVINVARPPFDGGAFSLARDTSPVTLVFPKLRGLTLRIVYTELAYSTTRIVA
jgi:hypothetical protein